MILSPSLLLFVISLVLFVVLFVLRRTGRIKEDTIKIAVDAAQLVALVVAVFSLIINSVPQQSSEVPKPVTIGIIELPSLTEAFTSTPAAVSSPSVPLQPASQPPTLVVTPSNTVLQINQSILSSNPVNINLTVTRVELLPSGAMRWHFLFSNDSKNNTNILLRYSGSTYLSDEYGHHYEMVQDAAGTDPQYIYQMELPTLAKLEHWIQFPAPMNGAKKFTVVLASSGSGYAAEFPTFVVMLP